MDWSEYTQNWEAVDDETMAWPVFAVAASPHSELIYTGDSSGRLTTYTLCNPGEALERQTSMLCAQTPIRRLEALANGGVFVQSDDAVQLLTDGGRKVFARTTLPNDAFAAAAVEQQRQEQAFVCTAAGTGSLLDLDTGKVARRVSVEMSIGAMSFDSNLTLGTAEGLVVVRDPRNSFSVVQSTTAFDGPVADLAVYGWNIYTCGGRIDAQNNYQMTPDPTVKIFDARNFSRPLAGIECVDGAPVRLQISNGDLWICHGSGFAETRTLSSACRALGQGFVEADMDEFLCVSAFNVTPSGQAALLADTAGTLHVWAGSELPRLSRTGRAPDALVPDLEPSAGHARGSDIDTDDERFSLSCVLMPPVTEPLLSRMCDRLYDVGRPVNFVDPSTLSNLKIMGAVGYAPNPRTGRRNQQHFGRQWRRKWQDGTLDDDKELTLGRSKFLSLQRRYGQTAPSPILGSTDGSSLVEPLPMQTAIKVPKQLQLMRIEYSRFGVEDFDFSLYNATQWSGLEGNISNAYANSLLQLLFFVPEFRSLMLAHCASSCPEPGCLSCQMGLLFRMLETAQGASCHATQLLHVLAARPEAAALALLEDSHGNPAGGNGMYALLVQRLLRFMLEQASNECSRLCADIPAADVRRQRPVERVFGFPQQTHAACTVCGAAHSRSSHVFAVDLESPQGGGNGLASVLAGGSASVKRAEALRSSGKTGMLGLIARSLERSETTRAWCAGCKKFQLLQTDKYMTQVPSGYLAFNFPALSAPGSSATSAGPGLSAAVPVTPANSSSGGPLLSSQGASAAGSGGSSWQMTLPTAFGLALAPEADSAGPKVLVREADRPPANTEAEPEADPAAPDTTGFRLVAVVSAIRDTRRGPEHLVAHVRIPGSNKWLLFNDFLVQPVPEESVTALHDWWRVPSLAIYANTARQELESLIQIITHYHPYKISTKILTSPKSVLDQQVRRTGRVGSPLQSDRRRNAAVALTKTEAGLLEAGKFKCALDAEFVVLEDAKMEVFSDGTRQVHRPPVHVLARLSAVRANEGDLHGVPFIDDYVAMDCPVFDLATRYSGIHTGDLTVGVSPYRLSTMKEVYKKLRLLVDSKSIIIGHGLKHDFRVCNIVVPPEQQRDTMLLFQSPQHIRPISLRFLYWYFCRKSIQTREHSSVEDAQATLKVFESYVRCARNSNGPDEQQPIRAVLDDIYTVGANMAWKLPDQKF
ncbi:poly(A)-specific ribonuclease [Coemansia sp. RSA 552]|nr:poly(A)-specific ribonuclease [Coemansia sp. RSA 552]